MIKRFKRNYYFVWIWTAEYLGLPYPPPYISMGSSRSLTGINYASASCGILPETGANFVSIYIYFYTNYSISLS